MLNNTAQKQADTNREQDLTKEVLRLQELVDNLIVQREMLQKELYEIPNTNDDARY